MRKLWLSLAAFLILMSLGCLEAKMVRQETIVNVIRVIEHDIDRKYTVEWEDPENPEIFRKTFFGNPSSIRIFRDVKLGHSKWMWVETWESFDGTTGYKLEYHAHSIDDLQPGGWNHGKFGSGTGTEIR